MAVLHRGPGVSQIGLARPVVVTGLSAREQEALAALEGGRVAPSRLGPTVRRALRDAVRAGHLEGDAEAPDGLTVGILGAGAVGLAAARALARHGHRVEFSDPSPASVEAPGVFSTPLPGQSCAGAAVRELLAAVPLAAARTGLSRPDAAIAVAMGAPDPVAWLPLLRTDTPHVLVTTDECGVDVGPLVLPGASACARCLTLERAQADPLWPVLALQCGAARRPVVEPHVAELAGSLAAAMLLAWASGLRRGGSGSAAAWALNAVWRVEPLGPPSVRPAWPHPECGCGAVEEADA